MLKLENIDKLKGVNIGGWMCYMVEEHKDHYTMMFELTQTQTIITQFRLFKEDRTKGIWELRARMDSRHVLAGQFHSNSYNDVQTICKGDLLSPDAFCRVLMKTLHRFNDILRYGFNPYHTSSLVSMPYSHNPTQPHPHLGSAASIASVTKSINGGQPNWYVSEEEVKVTKPTMWQTFKEMVKWDKWINILFPMKQTIEEVIPKKKKITAKKAAF